MEGLTKAQRHALKRIYDRMKDWDNPPKMTYLEFRRTVVPNTLCGCIMVPFGSMWLGVESDGHTHS